MLKKLIASAAIAASLIIPMDAKAQSTGWQQCGFHKTWGNAVNQYVSCRRVMTSPRSYKMYWSDGASDHFTIIRNGLVQDSTGTYWSVSGNWSNGIYILTWQSHKNGSFIVVRTDR